ncbi:integrating conjugative element protein, PFL_4704 family [Pseudomonas cedrina]|uniref:Integrating conjugative element protein n=2 Tax=Pseudomonas cedrina TaxID=651740 RepID=A0A1V2JZN1_PSECE|nr:TIGR03749 family integrating conjugative element protein [Pseudomonas cedrina]ONH50898.1 integrating conjugative element protein [Pseudomonas cedrina subsp. cedrina]SDS62687.1 integrating conjugative element protein, PFL_4704 family [Pseudomonas cedrina]
MKALLLSGLGVLFMPATHAVELLRWERLPLAVPLRVGEERVIFLDRNVRVGLPESLQGKLRVQIAGGAVYLLANEPITPSRLQLQDADDGRVILLDIAADPSSAGDTPVEPIRIIEPARLKQSLDDAANPPTPVPVTLTRYAAQSLYAPLRTLEPVPGIRAVPLNRDLPLATLLPERPIAFRALAAWQLENLWVTAVRLRNTSPDWIELDPRLLQGDFVSATFQHSNVGPKGQSTDTTVLYLVTRDHGLAESLLPAIDPVDAASNLSGRRGDEK